MAGINILNEEEFECIVEKLYPHYKKSKERARFYFNEKRLVMNAPEEYNRERLQETSYPMNVS